MRVTNEKGQIPEPYNIDVQEGTIFLLDNFTAETDTSLVKNLFLAVKGGNDDESMHLSHIDSFCTQNIYTFSHPPSQTSNPLIAGERLPGTA